MIQTALQFIAIELNQYLKSKFGVNEDIVTLNQLLGLDGSELKVNRNKLVITLLNIGQEELEKFNTSAEINQGRNYNVNTQNHNFQLSILVSSNFENYSESLGFIDEGMQYFQNHDLFQPQNYPSLPTDIEKLELTKEEVNYQEMNHILNSLGIKYKPSFVLKIRFMTRQKDKIDVTIPQVKK